jgi:hypothetical protein
MEEWTSVCLNIPPMGFASLPSVRASCNGTWGAEVPLCYEQRTDSCLFLIYAVRWPLC